MKDYHKISLEKISRQLEVPDGYIRLSGPLEHDNIVNGDGLRVVLWTQGCPNHCKGCQNPETWDYEAGALVKIDDLKKELKEFRGQAGITFCGGEPFVQAKACKEIAYAEQMGYSLNDIAKLYKSKGGKTYFDNAIDVIKYYTPTGDTAMKTGGEIVSGIFDLGSSKDVKTFKTRNTEMLRKACRW